MDFARLFARLTAVLLLLPDLLHLGFQTGLLGSERSAIHGRLRGRRPRRRDRRRGDDRCGDSGGRRQQRRTTVAGTGDRGDHAHE